MTAPPPGDAPGRLTAEMVGNMFDKLWHKDWTPRPEPVAPPGDDGLYFGPCLHGYEHGERGTVHTREGWQPAGSPFIRADDTLTSEQLDRLKAEWERKRHGQPKVLGLPWHVRLRLAFEQAVTDAGIWLCDHRMWRAAGLLWWRR